MNIVIIRRGPLAAGMAVKFNPQEPRDERGRWTAGGAGGDVRIEEAWRAGLSNRMVRSVKESGGFTIDDRTGANMTDGIAVGGWSKEWHKESRYLSARDVQSWLDEHKEELEKPGMVIGGWRDEKTNEVWLDLVKVFPMDKKDEAVKVGKEKNQIAVADLSAIAKGQWDKAFIDTGGSGVVKSAKGGKKPSMILFKPGTTAEEIAAALKGGK